MEEVEDDVPAHKRRKRVSDAKAAEDSSSSGLTESMESAAAMIAEAAETMEAESESDEGKEGEGDDDAMVASVEDDLGTSVEPGCAVCGKETIRVVSGAANGRVFLKCSDPTCTMFQWADVGTLSAKADPPDGGGGGGRRKGGAEKRSRFREKMIQKVKEWGPHNRYP